MSEAQSLKAGSAGRLVIQDEVGTAYDHATLCIADNWIVAVVSDLAHITSSFSGAL